MKHNQLIANGVIYIDGELCTNMITADKIKHILIAHDKPLLPGTDIEVPYRYGNLHLIFLIEIDESIYLASSLSAAATRTVEYAV